MHALISYPDGTPIMIAGPCWPFCIFVTVPLIVGISLLVVFFVIEDYGLPQYMLYVYCLVVVFTLVALYCVSCRDPGLMERVTDEEAGEGGWYYNEQVASFRPRKSLNSALKWRASD
jgi:hypothetical protein